jgi:hypothetical protein
MTTVTEAFSKGGDVRVGQGIEKRDQTDEQGPLGAKSQCAGVRGSAVVITRKNLRRNRETRFLGAALVKPSISDRTRVFQTDQLIFSPMQPSSKPAEFLRLDLFK